MINYSEKRFGMGIIVENDEKNPVFHLQTVKTSYIMAVKNNWDLGHVYWGKKIRTPDISRTLIARWACFDVMEPAEKAGGEMYSLDYLAQEYPSGGGSDYRQAAIEAEYADGSRYCPLRYQGYRLIKGKPELAGLPAVYAAEEEAESLEIELADEAAGLHVYLLYGVLEKADVITRSVRVVNRGKEPVRLNRISSASVDFEHASFEMLELPGAWGRERYIARQKLHAGEQCIGSRRGASSHQMNPFLALLQPGADEVHGEVYGMNLVYSGNFHGGTEVDQLSRARVYLGMGDDDFSWLLEPSESFVSPEAVLVYTPDGLGEMSRIYHRVYRDHLVRGKYQYERRPVLVNNWEATYFDFNEEKILKLADEAKELGIELLVLDDGWFGKRNDDRSSLGDWFVNKDKLPDGIPELARKVNEKGLKFGLWMEPEMISKDSELYRAHPDWCIHIPGRERLECRTQLTLDLSREDVCDWLIGTINGILSGAPIGYVKWDMNRHMSNVGSALLPKERQRETAHRYMLGLYRVLEAVVGANPEVLFESCSGGGGRFDAGMLYYMPQTWTSDDTDPVERLYIQYGTSLVYPASAMGAHVSAVPNHQSGRVTPLKMRADVAMSGNFGYELDLETFTEEEKDQVREQIRMRKKVESLVSFGDMYRLASPFEGNDTAWMYVSEDKKQFFFAYFRIQANVNPALTRVRLQGILPDRMYRMEETGQTYRGDELMQIGILLDVHGDYQSVTGIFTCVD